jgi:hypothetical protein
MSDDLRVKLASLVGELSLAREYKAMQYVARALTVLGEVLEEKETEPVHRAPMKQPPKRKDTNQQHLQRARMPSWIPKEMNLRQALLWEHIHHRPTTTLRGLLEAFPDMLPNTLQSYVRYLETHEWIVREDDLHKHQLDLQMVAIDLPGYDNKPITAERLAAPEAVHRTNAPDQRTPPTLRDALMTTTVGPQKR